MEDIGLQSIAFLDVRRSPISLCLTSIQGPDESIKHSFGSIENIKYLEISCFQEADPKIDVNQYLVPCHYLHANPKDIAVPLTLPNTIDKDSEIKSNRGILSFANAKLKALLGKPTSDEKVHSTIEVTESIKTVDNDVSSILKASLLGTSSETNSNLSDLKDSMSFDSKIPLVSSTPKEVTSLFHKVLRGDSNDDINTLPDFLNVPKNSNESLLSMVQSNDNVLESKDNTTTDDITNFFQKALQVNPRANGSDIISKVEEDILPDFLNVPKTSNESLLSMTTGKKTNREVKVSIEKDNTTTTNTSNPGNTTAKDITAFIQKALKVLPVVKSDDEVLQHSSIKEVDSNDEIPSFLNVPKTSNQSLLESVKPNSNSLKQSIETNQIESEESMKLQDSSVTKLLLKSLHQSKSSTTSDVLKREPKLPGIGPSSNESIDTKKPPILVPSAVSKPSKKKINKTTHTSIDTISTEEAIKSNIDSMVSNSSAIPINQLFSHPEMKAIVHQNMKMVMNQVMKDSLIPALEASISSIFLQVNQVLESCQIHQSSNNMNTKYDHDNKDMLLSIRNIEEQLRGMSKVIVDINGKVDNLAKQNDSIVNVMDQNSQQIQRMQLQYQQQQVVFDPIELIAQGKISEALESVVNVSDFGILINTLSKLTPSQLLGQSSRLVQLCIIHRLTQDISIHDPIEVTLFIV